MGQRRASSRTIGALAALVAPLLLSDSLAGQAPSRAQARLQGAATGQPYSPRLRPRGVLAAGTRFATTYYDARGRGSGPTVLIVAGIHGDERAPPIAAKALLHLKPTRGRLVIVPKANREAHRVGKRFTPGVRYKDLNRNFPVPARPPRTRPLGHTAVAIDPAPQARLDHRHA